MALNFNIPMPDISNSFSKGFGLTDNLMQQILGRNQLAQKTAHDKAQMEQLERHFQQNFGLSKAAAGRAAQAAADAHKLSLQQQDPLHKIKEYEAIKNYWKSNHPGMAQNQGEQQSVGAPQEQPMTPFSGAGMPSNEAMQNLSMPQAQQPQQQAAQMPNPQQMTQQTQQNGLFGNLSPDEQMMMQMAGIKVPAVKEAPEQKRYAELRDKIQLENYKTQQKKALEEQKDNLKKEETKQKTIDTAKSDLPHLEDTLSALKKMQKIAENNPDLFGHSGIMGFGSAGAGERFAKTTDNPNAGAWQTLGLGPIVAAESKMSSKGNILALKSALANKPNFEENQKVALSKLKANIKQIEKTIADTKSIAGIDSGFTRVYYGGKSHKVPNSQVEEALKAGGSLNG